jgi:RNA polymerase sigma-70 factor (ECF subfamily)
MDPDGLEAVFLAHRPQLLGFLRSHGAGEAAEDLLQELWLKVRDAHTGPIAQPLSYLYRAANNLILDRYRSERQATTRNRNWIEASGGSIADRSDDPDSERVLIGRETLGRVRTTLSALGTRTEHIFRRHRLDGISQRDVASELGVSLSTVESDLRKATRALVDLKKTIDEV